MVTVGGMQPAGEQSPRDVRASKRILLFDGGMGTTLEALGADVSGAMWGSELVHSEPYWVEKVHRGFAEAGSDLIMTNSYQMSMEKLLATFPAAKAEALLRDTVHLASASSSFLPSPPGIVLSMGAFGASQCRGEEYTANYPPPHGPASQHKTAGNFFLPDYPGAQEAERAAELALKEYHLSKLRVVAHDREAWAKVECVGFETIPAFAEIRAARAAMEALKLDLRQFHRQDGPPQSNLGDEAAGREWWDKPFWITSAYTEGEFPQYMVHKGDITPARVVEELLRPLDGHAVPDGIGLNCTHPRHLPSLIPRLTAAVAGMSSAEQRPRLVVYPDGGAKYDAIAKEWTTRDFDPASWAGKVLEEVVSAEKAETADGEKVWSGVIVGGCCKTSFAEIKALGDGLQSISTSHT